MSGRVLVAYASKSGATEEVARAVAEELADRGHAVDLKRIEDAGDPRDYHAVVVGSAVRFGKWLAQASKFVEAHRAELSARPTAFFTVHGLATDDSEASRKQRQSYVAPLHQIVNPKCEAFFGGRIDYARLGLGERLIAKVVKAPEHDFRDWTAIRAWADEVDQVISGSAA